MLNEIISYSISTKIKIGKEIKEKYCYIILEPDYEIRNLNEYVMPDGRKIKVKDQKFKATEILFNLYLYKMIMQII